MEKNISFKRMRKAIILSASFLLAFSSCKKEGDLNPDFVENTSSSAFADDIKIETFNRKGNRLLADQISTALIGAYRDSAFGLSTASFYVQPLLPSNSLVLGEVGEQLLIDSVILSLEYSNFFGDSSFSQTIDVFRLDEALNSEELYYSDTSIAIQPALLGSKTFVPSPSTTTIFQQPNSTGGIDTIEADPQLRIRLDDAFGSEILSKSGQVEFSNNTAFTDYFKGLKVTPNFNALNNNQNAILYFALTASETKMTVYYRAVDGSANTLKKSIDFPINTSSVRFSTFNHDFSQGAVNSILNDTSSLFSYSQAMAGLETNIKFPDILNRFKNQNVVVNKAELVFPVVKGSYSEFGVANALILASKDENELLQFIPDFFESPEYFGGVYNPETASYSFNIARYIQQLINGKEEGDGLTLLVTGSAVKAERVVLGSAKNPNNKIKLNLYYSNTQ